MNTNNKNRKVYNTHENGISMIILHQNKSQSLKKPIQSCIYSKLITYVIICSPYLTDVSLDTLGKNKSALTENEQALIKLCEKKGRENIKIVTTLDYDGQIPTTLFIQMNANVYLHSDDIIRMVRDAREDHFSRGSYRPKIKFNRGFTAKSMRDFLIVYLLLFEWIRSILSSNKSYIFNNNKYYNKGSEDITPRVFIYKKLPNNRELYTWSSTPKVNYDFNLSNKSKAYYGCDRKDEYDNGWLLFKRLYQKIQSSIFTWFLALPCFMVFGSSLIKIITGPEQWLLAIVIYFVTGLKINSFIKRTFIYDTSIIKSKKSSKINARNIISDESAARLGLGKQKRGMINFWFMFILHPLLATAFVITFLIYGFVDYVINDD